MKKKAVRERGGLEFNMKCVKFLSNTRFGKKSLEVQLVRSLFCLRPKKMAEVPEECIKAFEAVLTKLIEAK